MASSIGDALSPAVRAVWWTPARRLQGLWVALLAIAAAALAIGAVAIPLFSLIDGSASLLQRTLFTEIRLPRVLLAGVAGAGLGLAGAALQGLFRNPLADPGLIGVSGGAAVGAIAMIVFGSAVALPESFSFYAMPIAAVTGASLATGFLLVFSRVFGHFSVVTMLLVGVALNALATVVIGAFQYLSDDAQLRTLTFWMMGSFGRATWPALWPALMLMVLSAAVLLRKSRALDLLQLGESEARALGIDTVRLKWQVVLCAATVVGAGVALSGIVAFVGLVVPHLVRLFIGANHSLVLPGSTLLGAALAICADLVARTVVVPAELPVGLVTSAIGAPFFLYLIARVRPV
ncbi:MAG: iron ABC transporter permease [Pseudomonadota bacterium]